MDNALNTMHQLLTRLSLVISTIEVGEDEDVMRAHKELRIQHDKLNTTYKTLKRTYVKSRKTI